MEPAQSAPTAGSRGRRRRAGASAPPTPPGIAAGAAVAAVASLARSRACAPHLARAQVAELAGELLLPLPLEGHVPGVPRPGRARRRPPSRSPAVRAGAARTAPP